MQETAFEPSPSALLGSAILQKAGQNREFAAGEVIFEQGKDDHNFYVVLEGIIEISLKDGQNQKRTIAYVHPGEMLGEGVLLGKIRKPVTAKALTSLKLKALSKESFDRFTEESPKNAIHFLLRIVAIMNQRINRGNIKMMALFEMSDMLQENRDDLNGMARGLVQQLLGLAEARDGLLILKNPFSETYRTVYSSSPEINEKTLQSLGIEKPQVLTGQGGHWLLINLKDFGAIGLRRDAGDPEFADEDLRMTHIIAAEAASAIEEAAFRASEKAKTILHQQKITL